MMKQSSSGNSPVPCEKKAEEETPTRWQRFKRKFYRLKRSRTKKTLTKIKSSGILRGQWRQEDLPKIVKKIVDNNPGLTSIEIYSTEIHWHCEQQYYDLFPKKKLASTNPSKREDE
jgi:hypothetical protein